MFWSHCTFESTSPAPGALVLDCVLRVTWARRRDLERTRKRRDHFHWRLHKPQYGGRSTRTVIFFNVFSLKLLKNYFFLNFSLSKVFEKQFFFIFFLIFEKNFCSRWIFQFFTWPHYKHKQTTGVWQCSTIHRKGMFVALWGGFSLALEPVRVFSLHPGEVVSLLSNLKSHIRVQSAICWTVIIRPRWSKSPPDPRFAFSPPQSTKRSSVPDFAPASKTLST